MRLFAALLAALATTSAPARPPARLFVTALDTRPSVAAETDVDLIPAAPTTSVDVYVPTGYSIDLGARPGTVIGAARTSIASSLVVARPGLWKATGLTVAVVPANGGYRLECSLDRPSGEIDLDIERGLTNPPSGIAVWRASASGMEARSLVAFPQALTVRAATSREALEVSGRLLFAGKSRAGVNVHLAVATRADFQDAREVGSARTDAGGRYRLTARHLSQRNLLLVAYVNFYVAGNESISPPTPEIVSVPG